MIDDGTDDGRLTGLWHHARIHSRCLVGVFGISGVVVFGSVFVGDGPNHQVNCDHVRAA